MFSIDLRIYAVNMQISGSEGHIAYGAAHIGRIGETANYDFVAYQLKRLARPETLDRQAHALCFHRRFDNQRRTDNRRNHKLITCF